MMTPYRRRKSKLGTGVPETPKVGALDFDFTKCRLAQYIIEKQKNQNLKHKNGKPTELFIHAKDCSYCKIEPAETFFLHSFTYSIELSAETYKKFTEFHQRNTPSVSFDECIKLMMKEIEFYRSEK